VERESLTQLLEQGLSVEKIAREFGTHPSTVSYWMRKHGLEAVNRHKHAARGGIERQRLEALVRAGSTIAQLATELGLSKTTVRHWLRRYGLSTDGSRRAAARATDRAAPEAAPATVTMGCLRHGQTEFSLEGRGYYRCKRCRVEAVTNRRRRVKALLVAEAGGCCVICGYSRCVAALSFHHLDPAQKRLHVSAYGNGLSIATLRAEASKCVLLCANCHAEVENGVATVPLHCAKGEQALNTP
jgi:transposase-like protein